MLYKTLTSTQLKNMILGAANILENNKDTLDALNVFPVPDGDTGTNMSLTMLYAAREVSTVDEEDLKAVVQALSLGALKGARGNSGVILSQIFSGFSNAILNSNGVIDVELIANALTLGVEYAYKAVMKPKEGTILTVARVMAETAKEYAQKTDNVYEQLVNVLIKGEEILRKTPDMLPVLKEANVVDAGGAGFIVIIMGFKSVLDGEEIIGKEYFDVIEELSEFSTVSDEKDIEFAYCTEFFIKNIYKYTKDRDIDKYRHDLSKIGDCVLVVGDLNLVKTHVHTNEPGTALQYAQILGELSQIKIDNMREQHRELSEVPPTQIKDIAVVAVVSGEGIKKVLKDWQVDCFVEGGQSMNPSTQDILHAIEKAPSNNVIVLPNNKNIILAADQAGELSHKNVTLIHSKSMTQGIAAGIAYDPEASMEVNKLAMEKAISQVTTGQITNAIRNTKLNGCEIKEGDYIGICDDNIVSNSADKFEAAKMLLNEMITPEKEIVSIYYGKDVDEDEAKQMLELVKSQCENCDTEMLYGGQSVYQYYISAE